MRSRAIPILALTAVLLSPSGFAQPVSESTSPVQRFSDASAVLGAYSTLIRSADALVMNIKTSDLDVGSAYTVWWVIFNHPENCSAPCNIDDVRDPALRAAVKTAVGFAAGHVVSINTKGNFAARLAIGDLSGFGGGTDTTPPPPLGPGLLNPLGAEVHLVVRSHGPQIPGLVDDQIHTFGGGCTINVCIDRQFSIHLPPS